MPEYTNRIEIEDDDNLLRRISPENQKGGRINSSAFRPPRDSNNISVDIAKLTTANECLSGLSGFWVAKINTGFVRGLELTVSHQPTPENYAHAEIEGKFTDARRKQLARHAEIILT